jgi:hypothetical protein
MFRFALLAPCLCAALAAAQAHDIYGDLRGMNGSLCCNNQDCHPTRYRFTPDKRVEMFVEGKWMLIARHAIQYRALSGDTGETDGGHWCGRNYGHGPITYCAVLPPKGS